jgi:hypothetical protein
MKNSKKEDRNHKKELSKNLLAKIFNQWNKNIMMQSFHVRLEWSEKVGFFGSTVVWTQGLMVAR